MKYGLSHFHTSRIYNDIIFFARLNEKGGGGKRKGVFYYTLHLKVHFRSCHFIQCTIADTLQACKYFITECLLEFAFKRGCAVLSTFFLIDVHTRAAAHVQAAHVPLLARTAKRSGKLSSRRLRRVSIRMIKRAKVTLQPSEGKKRREQL